MATTRMLLVLAPLALTGPASAQGTAEQRTACGPEAMRLCASALPDIGRITACMREKRDLVSPACRTAMDSADSNAQPRAAEGAPSASSPAAPTVAEKPPMPGKPRATVPVAEGVGVRPRSTEARAPLRFDARANTASAENRHSRRRAARRVRPEDRDMAEAMYWMRRVTGYSGTLDVRAFERSGFGDLAAVFR